MMTSGNRNQGHGRGGGNSGHGQGNQTVSTPTFVPSSGSFVSSVQVAIVCATEGATIRYTLDGSTPTGLSPVYTSPLTLTETKTIKAIASKNGSVTSAVGSVTLTVTYPPLPAVTISPAAGHYEALALLVTLSHTEPGVTIHYTTTGDNPTTSDPVYSGTINLLPEEGPITVKAIAVKTGWSTSPIASAIYDLVPPVAPAPTFSPTPGNYVTQANVTISSDVIGADIHYEVGGIGTTPDPTVSSPVYFEPLVLNTNQTIKAYVVASGYQDSTISQANYLIAVEPVVIAPPSGSYESPQDVLMSCATPDASIYYTMADYPTVPADPATSGILYDGNPVHITPSTNFRAIARKNFCTDSVETQAEILLYVTEPLPTVVLSNQNMLWDYPSNGRGTLTMDYAVTLGNYAPAFVEFQWSADGNTWPGSEWDTTENTTWQQQDVADKNAVPEVFYMRARYVDVANTPNPTVAGPWSNTLTYNTGDYPF